MILDLLFVALNVTVGWWPRGVQGRRRDHRNPPNGTVN